MDDRNGYVDTADHTILGRIGYKDEYKGRGTNMITQKDIFAEDCTKSIVDVFVDSKSSWALFSFSVEHEV